MTRALGVEPKQVNRVCYTRVIRTYKTNMIDSPHKVASLVVRDKQLVVASIPDVTTI